MKHYIKSGFPKLGVVKELQQVCNKLMLIKLIINTILKISNLIYKREELWRISELWIIYCIFLILSNHVINKKVTVIWLVSILNCNNLITTIFGTCKNILDILDKLLVIRIHFLMVYKSDLCSLISERLTLSFFTTMYCIM